MLQHAIAQSSVPAAVIGSMSHMVLEGCHDACPSCRQSVQVKVRTLKCGDSFVSSCACKAKLVGVRLAKIATGPAIGRRSRRYRDRWLSFKGCALGQAWKCGVSGSFILGQSPHQGSRAGLSPAGPPCHRGCSGQARASPHGPAPARTAARGGWAAHTGAAG